MKDIWMCPCMPANKQKESEGKFYFQPLLQD